METLIPRTRRSFGLGLALALAVQAGIIIAGVLFIRSNARSQLGHRDAVALHATTLMEQLDLEEEGQLLTEEQIGFDAAVRASRLKGVIGIRFYDGAGTFTDSFPANILPIPLSETDLADIKKLIPAHRFLPDTPLDRIFIYLPQFKQKPISRAPIQLVTVPLHQHDTDRVAGAAQFIIEGQSLAKEYRTLDAQLLPMAGGIFLISALLLVLMLWPAFRRVQRLTRELALHSQRLQLANEELALTARVSAVGAVSAHLMHGLKNPLASLSRFVAEHEQDSSNPPDQERQDALAAARRMQRLVERTTEVLSDAKGEPTYELTVEELGCDILQQVQNMAAKQGVQTDCTTQGNCTLSSRTANLVGLILVNLLENAIQVSKPGATVLLNISRIEPALFFRVVDHGPGFPEDGMANLFLPKKSTREGGSGIGLAIARQIADHLGAGLSLEKTSSDGCTFVLELPESICLEPTPPNGPLSPLQ
jgi:signal transduction histidine kinase